MEHSMIAIKRRYAWYLLSEAFVDAETDYDHMAQRLRKLRSFGDDEIISILWNEVAPFCSENLAATPPPIWTVFKYDAVVHGVCQRQRWAEGSFFGSVLHKMKVRNLRRVYKMIEEDLRAALLARPTTPRVSE